MRSVLLIDFIFHSNISCLAFKGPNNEFDGGFLIQNKVFFLSSISLQAIELCNLFMKNILNSN